MDAHLHPPARSGLVLRADGALRRASCRSLFDRYGGDAVTLPDRYLLVRAGAVYFAVMLTAAGWLWRRPGRRTMAPAFLATMWNVPVVLAVQLVAARTGWWTFDADGGL